MTDCFVDRLMLLSLAPHYEEAATELKLKEIKLAKVSSLLRFHPVVLIGL